MVPRRQPGAWLHGAADQLRRPRGPTHGPRTGYPAAPFAVEHHRRAPVHSDIDGAPTLRPSRASPGRLARVTTVLLVRHGLTALTGPILSGRRPGISLDERGRVQASALADRLRPLALAAIVSSPLDRCAETAGAVAARRGPDGAEAAVVHDDRLLEVDYGAWTGGEIRALEKEPLWRVVQSSPSAVTFPDGESLRGMSARAVEAIRDWNARLGPDATWLACTHADVIRALLADALGLHLDGYGRIHVDPCSVSVVRYGTVGATVLRMNDTGGSAADLVGGHGRRPARPRRAKGVQSAPSVARDPDPPTEDR